MSIEELLRECSVTVEALPQVGAAGQPFSPFEQKLDAMLDAVVAKLERALTKVGANAPVATPARPQEGLADVAPKTSPEEMAHALERIDAMLDMLLAKLGA